MKSEKKPQFWLDKIAQDIIDRREKLNRKVDVLRVESGIGASGFPHIGSVGDSLRAYGIKLALENLGYKSELIAYSDDRDGLRKIPVGVPKEYSKYIGMPVSEIPDPWGCHSSYGEHISSMLIEALEKLGIEFTFISGTEAYKSGLLDKQISRLLANSGKVDRIIREEVGSSKPEGWVHYWPRCEKCGRIYTTRVIKVIPEESKVIYACDQEFKGIKGCGYVGEASYLRGDGKLSWKGEFAARWAALGIVFEPHGKDITDSFRVNARISREILDYEPPMTVMYEMFLDSTKRKISKSIGNVITPQMWMKFSPPEALRMLMFKRYRSTRSISLQRSPLYINELENGVRKYHNLERIRSERDKMTLKRLMEYTYLMKGVPTPWPYRYTAVLNVVAMLPRDIKFDDLLGVVADLISKYYDIEPKSLLSEEMFRRYVYYARNYVESFGTSEIERIEIDDSLLNAIDSFVKRLKNDMGEEVIQDLAFNTARELRVSVKAFFQAIYMVLLGQPQGPKLGPLLRRIGIDRFKKLYSRSLEEGKIARKR